MSANASMDEGLDHQQLNRCTLSRQMLLQRERIPIPDVISRVVGLQAQEPVSPYVGLWNRVAEFEPGQLTRELEQSAVVKATLMRITLHIVSVSDYGHFHQAMVPTLRAAGLNDRRFRQSTLTVEQADDLVMRMLDYVAKPRQKDDVVRHLAQSLGEPISPGVWRALRMYAPLWHAPGDFPWAFGRSAQFHAASSGRSPDGGHTEQSRMVGLQHLVRQYLLGFGPATVGDFRQFTMIKKTDAQAAFDALAEELVTYRRRDTPSGDVLYDLVDGPGVVSGQHPSPARLLPMWDSTLLAYADRSRVIPDHIRAEVIRRNGDVLPAVLVNGKVAGIWRPVDTGVEVTPLVFIESTGWEQIEGEVERFGRFLDGRDPNIYHRYRRWWSKLPENGRRLLPFG